MSARYWVGGSGNANDTGHWSTSSGGASGASVPGTADDAIWDSLSSAVGYTVTLNIGDWGVGSLNFGAPLTGVITLAAGSNGVQPFAGNVTFHSGLINNWTGYIAFRVSSPTVGVLTTNGVVMGGPLFLGYTGTGTVRLGDNLTSSHAGSSGSPALRTDAGIFDNNGKTITLTAGSPFVAAGFTGSAALYDLMWDNNTASGVLTFNGAVTMRRLQRTGTNAQSVKFTAGTTATITGAGSTTPFPSGTSGNLLTIGSVTASSHTLSFTGTAPISADYLSISRSTVTQTATAYAGANSTDGGNNSNWNFTVPGSSSAIKTIMGLPYASVKTVMGLPIASVKTIQGLT